MEVEIEVEMGSSVLARVCVGLELHAEEEEDEEGEDEENAGTEVVAKVEVDSSVLQSCRWPWRMMPRISASSFCSQEEWSSQRLLSRVFLSSPCLVRESTIFWMVLIVVVCLF